MVVVPAVFPVTTPVLLTVAILVLLLVHVTFLLVASSGFIVAVKVTVFPTATVSSVLFNVILSTGIFVTVISFANSTSPTSFFATTFIV